MYQFYLPSISLLFSSFFFFSPFVRFLSPGMDITLKITFTPTHLSSDIRYTKLPCVVEGSTPLLLTLVGSCVAQSENETILFKTPVRKKQMKSITVTNNSSNSWRLKPVVDNEYWAINKTSIKLTPGQSTSFEVNFLSFYILYFISQLCCIYLNLFYILRYLDYLLSTEYDYGQERA